MNITIHTHSNVTTLSNNVIIILLHRYFSPFHISGDIEKTNYAGELVISTSYNRNFV